MSDKIIPFISGERFQEVHTTHLGDRILRRRRKRRGVFTVIYRVLIRFFRGKIHLF